MDDTTALLSAITDPLTLLMLVAGVCAGLILGVIPGVGGLFGLVVLVPFTYHLDPFAATALLLGVTAVTTLSDTIPAVLLGVPGTISAIATVEDGHPLARKNQAERALGAAFSASLLGGIFGALVLAAAIPFMRPIVLSMQTPDFLAVSLMGVLFVAMVSGRDGMKGLAALFLGIALSFVGLDSNTGEERFTGGLIYFWDGVPMEILFLGIFGFPEIIDLLKRRRISDDTSSHMSAAGLRTGIRDTVRNWRLVVQSSSLGAILGAIPGVGVTVIDWVAYGLARRQNREEPEFGEGNIKGVIAPESANNAKEGGYLIPTVALGLPGSVTMTILLAALNVQGLVPGPQMLEQNLSLIYAMVFFICAANIVGTLICLSFARPFSRIATIPTYFIFPVATVFLVMGTTYRNADPYDLVILLLAGCLGYFMKNQGWSRAALSLGFVLGASIERFFFLSLQLHGGGAFLRPLVLVAFGAVIVVAALAVREARKAPSQPPPPADRVADLLGFAALLIGGGAIAYEAMRLSDIAGLFPVSVGIAILGMATALLFRNLLRRRNRRPAPPVVFRERLHGITAPFQMSAYITLIFLMIYAVGYLAAIFTFVFVLVVAHAPRRYRAAALVAAGSATAAYGVFGFLVSVNWPDPWIMKLGTIFSHA